MTTTIRSLTAETFDEEIRGAGLPVVVDVWSPWCPPCKALEPVLEAIATEHELQLRVFKINSDDYPEIATRFGVMAVPTLLVFDRGDLVKQMVGAKGKGHLLQALADVLT